MSTFAIYLNAPNEAAWSAVRQAWPGRHFILDDRLAFVAPTDDTLTSDIAAHVGMDAGGPHGVVAEITSYFGYNRPDLWEWMQKVRV